MTLIDLATVVSALGLGFLGSSHCVAMCGGICSALSFALPADQYWRRWLILLGYNLGRVSSYVAMAALISTLNLWLAKQADPSVFQEYLMVLRLTSGAMLVAMGLYILNWWMGLQWLERAGQRAWRKLAPVSKSLLPVTRFRTAVLYGVIWGWLPCGLVYSALVLSITQTTVLGASINMLAFGIGTLPALFCAGILASKLNSFVYKNKFRALLGLIVILFGLLTILSAVSHNHSSDNHAAEHEHHHHY